MIKKTISYENYNEEQVTEDLYFHISKTELLDNLEDLKPRFDYFTTILEGPTRELKEGEVRDMIQLIKDMMELGYGERSEDGKRFRKSDDILRDFKDSAAYDEVLFGMFSNPEDGLKFLTGIMPKDLMAQAAEQKRPVPQDRLEKAQPEKTDISPVEFNEEDAQQSEIARLKAELEATRSKSD